MASDVNWTRRARSNESFVSLVMSLLELKNIVYSSHQPTHSSATLIDVRGRHGNRHVGMISDFGRRLSPSGLLRPPKGLCERSPVCIRASSHESFLAKNTSACCRLPLRGLIGLGSIMMERLAGTRAVPQVWS